MYETEKRERDVPLLENEKRMQSLKVVEGFTVEQEPHVKPNVKGRLVFKDKKLVGII